MMFELKRLYIILVESICVKFTKINILPSLTLLSNIFTIRLNRLTLVMAVKYSTIRSNSQLRSNFWFRVSKNLDMISSSKFEPITK